MKKLNLLILGLLFQLLVSAQAITNVTFQPDSAEGKDTYIQSGTSANTNYGTYANYAAISWTISSVPFTSRSLVEFKLSSIPSNAVITSAKLSLYCNTTSDQTQLHSGSNASYLEKVTSSWGESTATWNNQPTTSTTNRITLAQSTSTTQDYLNIDVATLVQDMVTNPSTNYGFMLKLATESTYRSIQFGSSDHPNSSKRPKLEISYYVPHQIKLQKFNGGERLVRNTVNRIQWNSFNATSNVSIYYTLDNGMNWTSITTMAVDTGSFDWMLPNLTSTQCKIRIASYEDPSIADTSDAVFSIATEPIAILSFQPDSAEGKDTYIQSGTSANTNYGTYANYAAISWTISSVPFTSRSLVEFKLSSIPSNAVITSAKLSLYCNTTSDQTQLHSGSNASYLEKVTSSWGESTATWNNQPTTSTTNRITLAQSTSTTQDYLNIDVATLVQDMVTNPSTNYGFMLKLATESTYRSIQFGSSDHPNSSKRPKLEVSYYIPMLITLQNLNSGEQLLKNTTKRISWTSFQASSNVSIQYSINNGSTWNTISEMAADTGSYDWFVPDSVSNQCLIRVASYEMPDIADTSNMVFAIVAPPAYTITSPNGGEIWLNDTIQQITWTGANKNGAKIEYTTNDTNWYPVTSNVSALSSSFNWLPSNINSSKVKLRIVDSLFPQYGDTSDAVFTLRSTPEFTFTNPSASDFWFNGKNKNITWTNTGTRLGRLEYSINNGPWVLVADSIMPTTANINFIPNAPHKSELKFRLYDLDVPSIICTSSAINIYSKPIIQVVTPNGGERIVKGTTLQITWNTLFSDSIDIYYSTNDSTWLPIALNVNSNNGTINWNVPDISSEAVRIKISDTRFATCFDTTDASFAVLSMPVITLVSPNGGELWLNNGTYPVTWTSSNINNLSIAYSTNDTNWNLIASGINAASGSYNWVLPPINSSTVKLKLTDDYFTNVMDTSNATFSILSPPTIDLLTPNGGEQWYVDSTYNVVWSSVNVAGVNLYYADNDSAWIPIATNVSSTNVSNIYSWQIPTALVSDKLKVKVESVDNTSLSDVSGNYFQTQVVIHSALKESVLTADQIAIYPNPSNGVFAVSMPSLKESYSLRIVDVSGKLLFERLDVAETSHVVDLGQMHQGVYFAEFTTASGSKVVKRILIVD